MKVYPEDIKQAAEQSKQIAENSKRSVVAPPDNPSRVDGQWQAAKRARYSK